MWCATMAVIVALRAMPPTIFGDPCRVFANTPGIPVPTNDDRMMAAQGVVRMARQYGKGSDLHRSALRNYRAGLHVNHPFRPRLP